MHLLVFFPSIFYKTKPLIYASMCLINAKIHMRCFNLSFFINFFKWFSQTVMWEFVTVCFSVEEAESISSSWWGQVCGSDVDGPSASPGSSWSSWSAWPGSGWRSASVCTYWTGQAMLGFTNSHRFGFTNVSDGEKKKQDQHVALKKSATFIRGKSGKNDRMSKQNKYFIAAGSEHESSVLSLFYFTDS